MVNKFTKNTRVDINFEKARERLMTERLNKGFAKFSREDLGMPEFTRLAMKTQSWKGVEEELRTKPKKEDVKRMF